MKILLTGDSHTAALKLGADLLANRGATLACTVDIIQIGGGISFTESFFVDKGEFAEMTQQRHQKRLPRLPCLAEPDVDAYQFYGICGPLHSSRLWRKKMFWQEHTPILNDASKAPVSAHLLKTAVLSEQRYMMELLALLKRIGVNLFVVEAPKPFRHHPILTDIDPEVVIHIDTFYKQVMCEWLAKQDIPVLAVPEECYDVDGFMLANYRHANLEDGYHANAEFGAVMLEVIDRFVQTQN